MIVVERKKLLLPKDLHFVILSSSIVLAFVDQNPFLSPKRIHVQSAFLIPVLFMVQLFLRVENAPENAHFNDFYREFY